MTGAASVTVIGDCLLDVAAAVRRPIALGGDTPAAVRIGPGGQAANLAVRLARRGIAVRLVAPVGVDAAGHLLREALGADGIRLLDLPTDGSGAVVAVVDADGERTMLSDRVGFPNGWAGAVRTAIEDVEWVACSGYALLDPVGERLAQLLAERGASRLAIAGCAVADGEGAALAAHMAAARPDLVFLNRREAAALAGSSAGEPGIHELADAVARLLGAHVAVTDARHGSALGGGRDPLLVPSRRAGSLPVDTTGAGDAYAAAFLAEIVGEPWPPTSDLLRRAMAAGTELGAAVAAVHGAQGRAAGEGPA